jgi:predicted ester cyclase
MTNKEIVTAWFSHIDKGNLDGLKNLLASNHSFRNPMTPAPLGKDEHLGMIQMMTGSLTGEHQLERIVSEGDWVAVVGKWSGKHTGEFNGIPATNKPIQFTFADVIQIENGKIAEELFEFNPMSIMAQIGNQ